MTVEFKDKFSYLPTYIDRFCSLHDRVTVHKRMSGTDTYICNEDESDLLGDDFRPKGSYDLPPNAQNKHLQRD